MYDDLQSEDLDFLDDELYDDESATFDPEHDDELYDDEYDDELDWEGALHRGAGEEELDFLDLDDEGDEFFGGLAKRLARAAKKAAKKLAPLAKRHAGKIGTLIGGAVGGPAGAAIGGKIGGFVKNLEDEDWEDGESDTEDEMNARMVLPGIDEGLAEAMAAAASKSTPSDAQALGGALTITITSRAPMAVKGVAPALASATGRVARQMASHPPSRPLIRVLPSIVRDTTATLSKKARKGKPVTRKTAARVMTKQAKRTLRSPPKLARALANNASKKRRIDKAAVARAERFG